MTTSTYTNTLINTTIGFEDLKIPLAIVDLAFPEGRITEMGKIAYGDSDAYALGIVAADDSHHVIFIPLEGESLIDGEQMYDWYKEHVAEDPEPSLPEEE